MATRNPMNQRYQGDGPGGQTRKSAASAKPVSKAASSVRIKQKPSTPAEKRAAQKAREKEAEAKAKLKAEREAEKAKAASIEAGQDSIEPPKKTGFFSSFGRSASMAMPQTPEYRKWRRLYWILIGVALVSIALSFLISPYVGADSQVFIVFLVFAYAAVFAAFFVDFKKVRPLVKQHNAGTSGKRTPKVLKHEQEAREQAVAIEAARKAAKAAKKTLQRRERSIVPGEEEK